jgi:pSer/pThr/pTyr-binding forkhead associated (FHA) protein
MKRRTRSKGTQDNAPTMILPPEKNQSHAGTEEPAKMVIIQGIAPGLQLLLDRPKTVIGRSQHNQFVLDSTTVSRWHAQVTNESNRYEIEDLNSRNGILINNQRLKPNERCPLFHGDTVRLGDQQLVFLNPCAFSDQEGISAITFDRGKVCAEVDALLERLPALKKRR